MGTGKSIAKGRPSEIVGTGPNPEGKGQVGFLLDWAYSSPRGVVGDPA